MNNSCHKYWDGGSKKLKEFLKKHESSCENNWICGALDLSDTVIEEKAASPAKAEGPQKRKYDC